MIYCDTSLLVAAFTAEAQSHIARSWLLAQPRSFLIVRDWSVTEFANAIARKQQRSDLALEHRVTAEDTWGALRKEFTHVAVTTSHFMRAARLADAVSVGLRTGDALHLAVVLDHQCELATFDRGFAESARALDIAIHPTA